jgi:hypothetical protein
MRGIDSKRGSPFLRSPVPDSFCLFDRSELLARLHREGTVHSIAYEETGARVLATVPPRLHDALAEFMVPPSAPRQ